MDRALPLLIGLVLLAAGLVLWVVLLMLELGRIEVTLQAAVAALLAGGWWVARSGRRRR
jgi:hypothetical protein